jgi:16S rRNA (cytosine967-C5)-methyltransferase
MLLRGLGDIAEFPEYVEGKFFIQDAGAALTVLAADPAPGMRVLDGCAAPAERAFSAGSHGGQGELISCDRHEGKLSLVSDGAQRLGLSFMKTRAMDAGDPDDSLIGCFDLVLADVPCSGFGV